MTFIEIQNEVIEKYNIVLCDGTKCDGTQCPHSWRRMHSCRMARKIYKWNFANNAVATFNLLHEIGHQETFISKMRRCESEYAATVWAIKEMKKYGFEDEIPDKTKKLYQDYILRERVRGLHRGGANYPTEEQLTLDW